MSKLKIVVAVCAKAGLPLQEFHDHWRHPHASFGAQISLTRSYAQNHRIPCTALEAADDGYEGVAEAWYDSLADAFAFQQEPHYLRDLVGDEPTFVDMTRMCVLLCHEDILMSGPDYRNPGAPGDQLWRFDRRPTCIKVLQFIDRSLADASPAKLDVELGCRVGALRHVFSRVIDVAGAPPSTFAGVRELWWPTLTSFYAGISRDADAWHELVGSPPRTVALLAQHERFW